MLGEEEGQNAKQEKHILFRGKRPLSRLNSTSHISRTNFLKCPQNLYVCTAAVQGRTLLLRDGECFPQEAAPQNMKSWMYAYASRHMHIHSSCMFRPAQCFVSSLATRQKPKSNWCNLVLDCTSMSESKTLVNNLKKNSGHRTGTLEFHCPMRGGFRMQLQSLQSHLRTTEAICDSVNSKQVKLCWFSHTPNRILLSKNIF